MNFAIIGAGPAGLYLAEKIAFNNKNAIVHIFEKRNRPFGLINYGVAPDMLSVKVTFESTLIYN